jgi:hypothetical protein
MAWGCFHFDRIPGFSGWTGWVNSKITTKAQRLKEAPRTARAFDRVCRIGKMKGR